MTDQAPPVDAPQPGTLDHLVDESDRPEVRPPNEDESAGSRHPWDGFDSITVLLAAIVTLFAHPVHLMLSRAYWLDEAWVAVFTRVPWSRVVHLSSSTPVGWALLLRLVPGSGLQRGRLVVVVFSALTVVMAYVLARGFEWASKPRARFAGVVAALVVMLAPTSLARNDLKQYTCDAFCTLVLLAIAARVGEPPRRPVWWLAVASIVALPFSSIAAFVAIAAFAGLLGSSMLDRDRSRAIEVLITGAATGAAIIAYFGTVIIPNTNPALAAYWNNYYLRGSMWQNLQDIWARLRHLEPALGMAAPVFLGLFVIGIVFLTKLRARAIAITMLVLIVELVVVARMRKYPFLDERTSYFLLVASLVVVAVGAVGILQAAYAWKRISGILVGLVAATLFMNSCIPYIDHMNDPPENTREQAAYVAQHRLSHDVILVNQAGAFGFSYYWPRGEVITMPSNVAQGFTTQVRGLDAIYAHGRTAADVLTAMRDAVARWRQAGPNARLYVVRSHVTPHEAVAWKQAFATLDVHPRTAHGGLVLVLGPAD